MHVIVFAITCIFYPLQKEWHPRIIKVDTKNRNPVQRKDADFCYGCQTLVCGPEGSCWTPWSISDLHHLLYADGHHCFRGHPFPECFPSAKRAWLPGCSCWGPWWPVFSTASVELYGRKKMLYADSVLPGDHLHVLPGGLPAHDVRGPVAERGGLRHCLHRHQHHRVRHDPCRTPGARASTTMP